MSEKLDRAAEVTKLARLLDVPTDGLAFLDAIPSVALARFRSDVTERLYAEDAGRLHRVAAASKLVPIPIAVKAAQLAFGPVLCAAVAGLLDPPHAVKIAGRAPTAFLADVAVNLDPRRAPGVLAAMPTATVVEVALELLRRREHVTIGRFVTYLPARTLREAITRIRDEGDILRVAFVMEGKDRLDDLLDIARDRIDALILAANEEQLWPEALDLIGHLSAENLASVAAVAATLDADVFDGVVAAALEGGLWEELLPLVAALPSEVLHRVAAALAARDDAELESAAAQAHAAGRWDALLPLALAFDDATRRRLAAMPLFTRDEVLREVVLTAATHGLWDEVLPLADALPSQLRTRVAGVLGELTGEQMLAALTAASGTANLGTLIEIALQQDVAGRGRVLTELDQLEDLTEFGALLDTGTPDAVWQALAQLRGEMPERVRQLVVARAEAAGGPEMSALFVTGEGHRIAQPRIL